MKDEELRELVRRINQARDILGGLENELEEIIDVREMTKDIVLSQDDWWADTSYCEEDDTMCVNSAYRQLVAKISDVPRIEYTHVTESGLKFTEFEWGRFDELNENDYLYLDEWIDELSHGNTSYWCMNWLITEPIKYMDMQSQLDLLSKIINK